MIAIIIFGPKKIPEVARSMGNGVRYFKNLTNHFKKEIVEVCNQIGEQSISLKEITSEIDDSIKGSIHRNM